MENETLSATEIAKRHGIDLNRELTSGFAAKRIREFTRVLTRKTRESRHDVFQDLSFRLMETIKWFDPNRATWEAFVINVLKTECVTQLQSRYRKRRYSDLPVLSLDVPTVDEDGQSTTLGNVLLSPHQAVDSTGSVLDARSADDPNPVVMASECTFDQLEVRQAVRDVVAKLTPREQRIYRMLSENSVLATQRKLRVSRRRMAHLFRKIRKALEEVGFGGDFAKRPSKLLRKRSS